MWFASPLPPPALDLDEEEILDLCLVLSPEVQRGPAHTLLVCLHKVLHYWGLPTLSPEHPRSAQLQKHLQQLEHRYNLSFVSAPTAALALWQLHTGEALKDLWAASFSSAQFLVPDKFPKDQDTWYSLETLLEDCGIRNIRQFLEIPPQHLMERFPPLALELRKRILSKEVLFSTRWHQANFHLQSILHASLTESAPSWWEEIQKLLHSWETRLKVRGQVLKGLHFFIQSARSKRRVTLEVKLLRPTRSAQTLLKILQEKWLKSIEEWGHGNVENFEDEIEEIRIEAYKLESESIAQLHLFNPQQEDLQESWNVLLGKLKAHETLTQSIDIGYYTPISSFIPERAFTWKPLDLGSSQPDSPAFLESPRRPLLLLEEAKKISLPRVRSWSQFLDFIQAQELCHTLEEISYPWDTQPLHRSYIRWKQQWIFWDHLREAPFLQGYFES